MGRDLTTGLQVLVHVSTYQCKPFWGYDHVHLILVGVDVFPFSEGLGHHGTRSWQLIRDAKILHWTGPLKPWLSTAAETLSQPRVTSRGSFFIFFGACGQC